MNKVINTYYAPVEGLATSDEKRLLGLWFDEWQRAGWEPQILGEEDARRHPRFEELAAKMDATPTINPRAYESACIYRHAALSAIGGGFMSDYDVYPVRSFELNPTLPRRLTIFQGEFIETACPSLIWGEPEMLDAFIEFFIARPDGHHAEVINGQPHYSDQHSIREFIIEENGAQLDRQVWNVFEPGYENANLIHFHRGGMRGLSPRCKHVPILLEQYRKTMLNESA